ncbi:transcription factor SRM1-like [Silene latifolia]|uniref:transcription factor SRM1-like n=1 Tax=Silene latifolia TaxID=37657 RepID=UPI003D778911
MPNLASWTREEEKAFENGIALHMTEQLSDEWEKIASLVPTKTIQELREHYQVLVDDVNAIESGKVTLPDYTNGSGNGNEEAMLSSSSKENYSQSSKEQKGNSNNGNGFAGFGASSMGNASKASKLEQERKKGIPWTEEEHRLFLLGLDKFGKGDWRSISRNYVITRTPTQVASHAQKYFIRLNSMNRDRRRSSIHDITSVNGAGLAANQAPITGQQNPAPTQAVGGAVAATGVNKHRAQPGIGMYGTQIGHPVTGQTVPPLVPPHMGSAVGTPLMLPPPGHHPHHPHHPHYAVPMAYPMAPPPMHR